MRRYDYRFDTLRASLEQTTGLKIASSGEVIGVTLVSSLRHQFGGQAERHYPFSAVMVLALDRPPLSVNELAGGDGWEPEMSY
jgi:hypothetical protein